MNFLQQNKNYVIAAVAVLVMVGLVAVGNNQSATAQSNGNQSANQAKANEESKSNRAGSQAAYSYTAQPGDTYSWMARKAVQSYGIVNNVKLSQAQIVAAETQLTNAAGSPVLNEGQKVVFKAADVKTTVESAQKLSAGQQAAWQSYVSSIDFNTDLVGERR